MNYEFVLISDDGLTKKRYSFDVHGTSLFYAGYYEYNRSSSIEPFQDELLKPLDFLEWILVADPNDVMWEDEAESKYESYRNEFYRDRPTKTTDGRRCMFGEYSNSVKDRYPLTDDLKKAILKDFRSKAHIEEQ